MNNSSKKIDSVHSTANENDRKRHRGREGNIELDQVLDRDQRRKKYSEGFNPEIKLDSGRPNNIYTNLSSLSSSFTSDIRNLKDTVDDKGRTPINHGLVGNIIDSSRQLETRRNQRNSMKEQERKWEIVHAFSNKFPGTNPRRRRLSSLACGHVNSFEFLYPKTIATKICEFTIDQSGFEIASTRDCVNKDNRPIEVNNFIVNNYGPSNENITVTPVSLNLEQCVNNNNKSKKRDSISSKGKIEDNKSSMVENNKITFNQENSAKLAEALKINSNVNSTLNTDTKEKLDESKSEIAESINGNNAGEIKEEVEIASNEIKADDGLGKVSITRNFQPLVPLLQNNGEGSKVKYPLLINQNPILNITNPNESVKRLTSLISNQENSSKTFANIPKLETPKRQESSLINNLGNPLGSLGANTGAEFKPPQLSQPTNSSTAHPNNPFFKPPTNVGTNFGLSNNLLAINPVSGILPNVNSSIMNNSNQFAIPMGGVNNIGLTGGLGNSFNMSNNNQDNSMNVEMIVDMGNNNGNSLSKII
jgi:hypothetical protein